MRKNSAALESIRPISSQWVKTSKGEGVPPPSARCPSPRAEWPWHTTSSSDRSSQLPERENSDVGMQSREKLATNSRKSGGEFAESLKYVSQRFKPWLKNRFSEKKLPDKSNPRKNSSVKSTSKKSNFLKNLQTPNQHLEYIFIIRFMKDAVYIESKTTEIENEGNFERF